MPQVERTPTHWTGGFRYISQFEKFRMQVEDLGLDDTPADPLDGGNEGNVPNPEWALRYTAKQKNHYYGPQTGVGSEAYLLNGFAISLDAQMGAPAESSRTSPVL